jgi:hypothetical protein
MSRRIGFINVFLLWIITLIPLSSASQFPSTIHRLDEKTFEHDTQASTGQTTGVWLIRFCTKHSHQCNKQRQAFLTAASHLLNSNILSASVDTTASPSLAARFHITKTPAFILLKDKKMYRLPATIATIATEEDLIQFAATPPLAFQKEVPPPFNIVSETISLLFDKIKQANIPILSSSDSPAVVAALALLAFVVIAPLVGRLISALFFLLEKEKKPQEKQD